MQKVKFKKGGKIKQVTNNEAHDLIEKGEAELVTNVPKKYNTTSMEPGTVKGYKIK